MIEATGLSKHYGTKLRSKSSRVVYENHHTNLGSGS
jgi:hypothetical protein